MSTAKKPLARTDSASPGDSISLELRILKALTRRGDLALALLITAVIALLVVPLPTFLLDALIAINLSASLALLMLSVYIHSPLAMSTFPSLLLLTTLFRLSLNIASTKLILLNGAAGHIIDTFGRMVVGGNVVVGLVVFLIIAIVQFIVIAKGAERVAEVGARFTLDGMPGKQMSIDADLRAGIIDKEEAQQRRREVEEESRLHGAMDGAMKFVKGDAIAGMLIALINIVAGMAIGVSMHGLSLGDAVDTYSVLSVGDGMVAQIPSLFVSIAAGILITRVDGRQRRGHLGKQIAREVLGSPMALLAASGLVATFILVPGLPTWPFLVLALALGGAGYLGQKASAAGQAIDLDATSGMPRDGRASSPWNEDDGSPLAVPLRLRLAPDLRSSLSTSAFDSALEQEKSALLQELGLPFPGVKLSVDAALASGRYGIDVQEAQVTEADLVNGNVFALADGARAPEKATPEERLASHLAWTARRHAEVFLGIQETHELLSRAARELPELTAEVQRAVPLQRIADVLRRLLEEGVSIRHLREICESLIRWGPREKDIVMLTEYVRIDLGRFLTRRYLDTKGQLRVILLGAEAEKALRAAVQTGPAGSFLALDPATSEALMTAAERTLSAVRNANVNVVLAPMDVRRYLKRFLASRFPSWTVLSFQELPSSVPVQAVGQLSLDVQERQWSA